MLIPDQHPISDHLRGRLGASGGPDLQVRDGAPFVPDYLAWPIATAADIHPAGSAPLVYFGMRYRRLGAAID